MLPLGDPQVQTTEIKYSKILVSFVGGTIDPINQPYIYKGPV